MAEEVLVWFCPRCGEKGWGVIDQMYHWKELHNAICKGDEMATTTPTRSPLEIARARVIAEQEKLAKLEAQEQLRESLGQRFRDGETVDQLMALTGWSEERVRSALAATGALVPRKRKLTPEETDIATGLLRSGSAPRTVADDMNVATSVIVRLAKELGIGAAPARKRSPEQMRDLIALEAQVRRIYGAGFAALGEALRKHRAEHGSEQETADTGTSENVVLTPEEQAKMEEPDANDIANWD